MQSRRIGSPGHQVTKQEGIKSLDHLENLKVLGGHHLAAQKSRCIKDQGHHIVTCVVRQDTPGHQSLLDQIQQKDHSLLIHYQVLQNKFQGKGTKILQNLDM